MFEFVPYIEDIYLRVAITLAFAFGGAFVARGILSMVMHHVLRKTETHVDDEVVDALQPAIFWSFILAALYAIIREGEVVKPYIGIVETVTVSAIVLLWSVSFVRVTTSIFGALKRRSIRRGDNVNDALSFVSSLIGVVIVAAAILWVLGLWGLNVTPALASAGVLGIAVAFAAQDMIANLFGGISIFWDKPYSVGDFVIIKEQYRGEVEQIGVRSTKVRTLENVLITIPNSVMVTDAVINETGFDPKLRVGIKVGVAYASNLQHVEDVVLDEVRGHKKLLKDPAPWVRYREFAESAVTFDVLFYIPEPSIRESVVHDVIKMIHARFRKERITIPFPQRDVHMFEAR